MFALSDSDDDGLFSVRTKASGPAKPKPTPSGASVDDARDAVKPVTNYLPAQPPVSSNSGSSLSSASKAVVAQNQKSTAKSVDLFADSDDEDLFSAASGAKKSTVIVAKSTSDSIGKN